MSLHRLVEHYSSACRRCQHPGELFSLTADAALEIGFDRLALVHGLWFRKPNSGLIRLDNFGEFAEIFVKRRYYLHDPALLACQRNNTAFSWEEMPGLIDFRPWHEQVLDEAHAHGLSIGLSLPVGVTGEPTGCCSFVTSKGNLPSRWRCRAAILIGAEAFREARRLHGYPARAREFPRLSPRKLEILELAAIGKTDREIAMIINRKLSTVETYMAQLRQAFDVYSRAQLAVAAVRFGLVAFDDAMSGF